MKTRVHQFKFPGLLSVARSTALVVAMTSAQLLSAHAQLVAADGTTRILNATTTNLSERGNPVLAASGYSSTIFTVIFFWSRGIAFQIFSTDSFAVTIHPSEAFGPLP